MMSFLEFEDLDGAELSIYGLLILVPVRTVVLRDFELF